MIFLLACIIFDSLAYTCLNEGDATNTFFIVSDSNTWVTSSDFPEGKSAVIITPQPQWQTANIPDASWIWDKPEAIDGEVCTFTVQFNIPGVVKSALLKFSNDDGIVININGQNIGFDTTSITYDSPAQGINVGPFLSTGLNNMEMIVTNDGGPAGLLYKLSVSSIIQ